MAMCVMAVVGVAPCQCFSPGANQITSPGRISSTGPSQRCAHPRPDVTINVWPNGWVCQAVRAPGSNVTLALRTRAGSGASNSGSMRTVPVNQSAGPLLELCEPDLFISIFDLPSSIFSQLVAPGSPLRADMPLRLISIYQFDRLLILVTNASPGSDRRALALCISQSALAFQAQRANDRRTTGRTVLSRYRKHRV